jgi:hypothetical protein
MYRILVVQQHFANAADVLEELLERRVDVTDHFLQFVMPRGLWSASSKSTGKNVS